jgi:hypothetical protein
MLNDFMNQVPDGLSFGVMVALLWFWLSTERLVTGRQYKRMVEFKDGVIADKDKTIQDQKEALKIKDDQIGKLIGDDNLTFSVLSALEKKEVHE